MYYEINVAKGGKHFFATHQRSLTNHKDFIDALKTFAKAFPKSEGYEISASRWYHAAEKIDVEAALDGLDTRKNAPYKGRVK